MEQKKENIQTNEVKVLDLRQVINLVKTQFNLKIERPTLQYPPKQVLSAAYEIAVDLVPNFKLNDDNQKVFTSVMLWATGFPFECVDPQTNQIIQGNITKGLYIAGSTGTGKTVLTKIADRLVKILKPQILYYHSYMGDKKFQWQEYRATEITNDISTGLQPLENYISEKNILIQDLGAEPREIMYMGNRLEPLRQIIEARGDNPNIVTSITSNIPLSKIKEFYGARVYSRLNEMCNYIELRGADHRIRQSK